MQGQLPNEPAPPVEGLPDWEPLTPELVEDEAVRGDFMLRWAAVLLALLMGCRQIVETATLVHVKTGQYLATHGFWPPKQDVFSATAGEHHWVNLSWLWDLVASGLFAIGEGTGLSLCTALLVALTWWMLGKTSRAGVSTWWGSILGVLALLASHPRLSGQPETITLVGLAATMWCLHAWRSSTETSATESAASLASRPMSLWCLVPGIVLWANLDPRMFLGLLLLLLWGLGDLIGSFLGRPAFSSSQRLHFWKVLGTCVVASCLNPFGVQSLWSPVVLYGTEYPAWRFHVLTSSDLDHTGALPLWTPSLWKAGLGRLPLIAGSLVLASALVSLVLNARRAHLGDVLSCVGFVTLACLSSQELAAASLVACVIGTLNAQQWYQAKFRQTYSVAPSELLFTRGGRAVTVLAFFALAVMSVNQMLFGADGKRVGMGLSNRLRALIEGYRSATAESLDNRPFNFVPQQGDVLVWLGQKPFLDSRLAVFSGRGAEDLLALHDQARHALAGISSEELAAAEASGQSQPDDRRANWQPIFDRFQITHAMPRLMGTRPTAYFRMLSSPDWRLTHLGSNCAVLYRADNPSPELNEFLKQHHVQFVKSVLQSDSKKFLRTEWPRARGSLQRYLGPPQARIDNRVIEAENVLMHLHAMAGGQISIDQPTAVAMAMLAIHKANEALADSADQAAAYQILGDAYSFLLQLESAIEQSAGVSFPNQLRFYQALGAYHQAVLLEPNSLVLRSRLLDLLQQQNRVDLVLRELQAIERLVPASLADDPEEFEAMDRRSLLQEQCQTQLDSLREKIDTALGSGEDPVALAQQVYAAGFVLEALRLMDHDRLAVQESRSAQALQGLLRLEAGDVEEAYNHFAYESEAGLTGWLTAAAWTRLAHGEYDEAIRLWSDEAEFNRNSSLSSVLTSLPLVQPPFHVLGQPPVWPARHALNVAEAQYVAANGSSTQLWHTAMCQLEAGKPQLASKTLSGLLEVEPETALRPLVRFYLFAITEELIDFEPPSEWIPINGDTFAPEESAAAEKK